jgi:hypothetical protein
MPNHSRNSQQPKLIDPKLPEVADREPEVFDNESCLDLSIDGKTGDIKNPEAYRVFMKRNLGWQQPPADLLQNIHARIERIKAGEE